MDNKVHIPYRKIHTYKVCVCGVIYYDMSPDNIIDLCLTCSYKKRYPVVPCLSCHTPIESIIDSEVGLCSQCIINTFGSELSSTLNTSFITFFNPFHILVNISYKLVHVWEDLGIIDEINNNNIKLTTPGRILINDNKLVRKRILYPGKWYPTLYHTISEIYK